MIFKVMVSAKIQAFECFENNLSKKQMDLLARQVSK